MIIFSDFDGTIYFEHDPARVTANLQAIADWRTAGHQFCIATGRSYQSLAHQLPELIPLCDSFILDGGSIILSRSAELIRLFPFEPSVISQIAELATLTDGILLYYTPTEESLHPSIANITKIRLWLRDASEIAPTLDLFRNLPAFVFSSRHGHNLSHPELADRTAFVEIIPRNSGKSHAVGTLLRELNLSSKEAIVVGDGKNDRDMLADFNGYMITGSSLALSGATFRATSSLAELISAKIDK